MSNSNTYNAFRDYSKTPRERQQALNDVVDMNTQEEDYLQSSDLSNPQEQAGQHQSNYQDQPVQTQWSNYRSAYGNNDMNDAAWGQQNDVTASSYQQASSVYTETQDPSDPQNRTSYNRMQQPERKTGRYNW